MTCSAIELMVRGSDDLRRINQKEEML